MSVRQVIDEVATFAAQHPERARFTEAARAELVGETEVRVCAGPHALCVDWPRRLGGTGVAATPVQHLLAALTSSLAISYRVCSEGLGIEFRRLAVDGWADTDVRGLVGAGLGRGGLAIRLEARIAGPESRRRYEGLGRAASESCLLLAVLRDGIPVETALSVEG